MADAAHCLRAGTARADITTDDANAVIRDRLYAKALVLDDGETRLAVITMDVTAIGARSIGGGYLNDVADDFMPRLRTRLRRELDIPDAHVLVNASHTHPPGRLLCDDDQQQERVFDAVRRATRNLTAVAIGAGKGREDRITMNRTLRLKNGRDWTIRHGQACPPPEDVISAGPINPEIGIIRIDRTDGTPLAVIYNFACHLLFGDLQGAITANIPGSASRLIEHELGHDAMALFLQGAAGDVIDVGFKDFSRPRDIEPLARMLAQSTLAGRRRIATGPGCLAVRSGAIDLPRRTDIPARLATLAQERDALLESLRDSCLNFETFLRLRSPAADAPSEMRAFTAGLADRYLRNIRAMERLTVVLDDLETLRKHHAANVAAAFATIPDEVQGLRLGDAVIVTSKAELLVEVGLNLRQASPFANTLVAAYSNGYLHYGAPAAYYERGGYEVTECLLAPAWQEIYERKAAEILRRLWVGAGEKVRPDRRNDARG